MDGDSDSRFGALECGQFHGEIKRGDAYTLMSSLNNSNYALILFNLEITVALAILLLFGYAD